jgi:hypothetical protein
VATGGDRVVSPVTGTRKVLTSGTRLLERADARLTGGAGLAAGEGARRQRGRACGANGPRGPDEGGEAHERELVRKRPNRGRGGFFLFLFLFLFPISISISFISFSFEQVIS